ncbi:hypothetical protein ACFLZ6_00360 [Nanoarchaeota archaeon]
MAKAQEYVGKVLSVAGGNKYLVETIVGENPVTATVTCPENATVGKGSTIKFSMALKPGSTHYRGRYLEKMTDMVKLRVRNDYRPHGSSIGFVPLDIAIERVVVEETPSTSRLETVASDLPELPMAPDGDRPSALRYSLVMLANEISKDNGGWRKVGGIYSSPKYFLVVPDRIGGAVNPAYEGSPNFDKDRFDAYSAIAQVVRGSKSEIDEKGYEGDQSLDLITNELNALFSKISVEQVRKLREWASKRS